ncbi:MAG TPA: hypothetical protein VJ726_00280, partial [Candidatus Limnocylindria bacterium]|nr:hypothetical protein [Candidatus Limnocylindria bacterium]
GDRQIGQLLAGRYRLAMSKGGDDVADVWHALDESTQTVVTLEILRDRGNDAARQRFLAEARRMAAIERPSVMRVGSIVDEGTDTFIVFEHLIPLPVVLTGLTAVARDVRPATKAAEDKEKTVVLTPAAPQAQSPFASRLNAVAGPTRAATQDDLATAETAPTIVELDGVREPSVPDFGAATTLVPETTPRATGSGVRGFIRDVMHDAQMDTLIEDAQSFISDARARIGPRLDVSAITSLAGRATAVLTRITASAGRPAKVGTPHVGAALPNVALPKVALPKVTLPKMALTTVALPKIALPKIALPGVPSLRPGATALIAHVRGNRIVLGAAALLVIAVVVVVSPLDDLVSSALRGGPAPSATAAPRALLVPAPFELPPLSAYGATFESQGPYPTTTPNGNVEWVVALRNTGSAGWYRGIEGAQAALALPDGAGVAVQSTDYVAPGQVGWFVVHFKARAELGTYTVQLLPRIDGRGPLPELGIFTVVTVAKNP